MTPEALIKDTDTQSFMEDVIKASTQKPVIVDFWTPGSPACAELTSELEALVKAANGTVLLVKINAQQNPTLAAQFQLQSVPTVYAIINGQPVDGFQGPMPKDELKKFVAKLAGEQQDMSEELKEAGEKLNGGDTKAAADLYAAILRADPENADALGGLIKCYINEGDLDAARETLEMLGDELASHSAIESARSALDLAEQTGDMGDLGDLETKSQANPDDHQARYDLALAYAGKNQRERAVEELLAIVKKAPGWNEGAARTQLITFFEAWGPGDETTIKGRRQLASLLF